MWAHLLVFAVAAIVTAMVTPLVARVTRRMGLVDVPSDPRKVHSEPVPTLGGLGMLVGFAAALGLAWLLPPLRPAFAHTSQPLGILTGVGLLGLVGTADDAWSLRPTVKLAGQIIAASVVVLFGVQIVYAWVPGVGVVSLGPDIGFIATVVAIVAMINAVNLIDGLDGLAAGVVGIGAVAFFVFVVVSDGGGIAEAVPTSAPMVAAALAGICGGFLVHNFHPASIFMGDCGAMILGLLLASSGVAYVGRSTAPSYVDFYGSIPLLVPVLVLAVPFLDVGFTVLRRLYRRQPMTMADRGHLHHLLMAFGHSHRRAVLVMYYWSALVATGAVALSLGEARELTPWLVVGGLIGVALTVLGISRPEVGTAGEPPEPRRLRRVG